jgi:hypothetical protein
MLNKINSHCEEKLSMEKRMLVTLHFDIII